MAYAESEIGLDEPNISDDNVVLSVRHPEFGTLRRIFKCDVTMSCVYDWIGYKSPYLMNFDLLRGGTELLIHLIHPDDGKVTVGGFTSKENNALFRLEARKCAKQIKLTSTQTTVLLSADYEIDRYNVISELFKTYNKRIESKCFHFN